MTISALGQSATLEAPTTLNTTGRTDEPVREPHPKQKLLAVGFLWETSPKLLQRRRELQFSRQADRVSARHALILYLVVTEANRISISAETSGCDEVAPATAGLWNGVWRDGLKDDDQRDGAEHKRRLQILNRLVVLAQFDHGEGGAE